MSPVQPVFVHPWDLSPDEAVRLQQELRTRVSVQPLELASLSRVAGVDVGFRDEFARAAVVVLEFPSLQLLEHTVAEIPVAFPYIPGLLSVREAPAILTALGQLENTPEVFIFDGQGLAHPRRFGIACHLGVLLDRPTLGCAKSILVGSHPPLAEAPGSTAELWVGQEVVGAALRTKANVKPVYISVGNHIDLASAVQLALACTRGYRLPEPTRLADRLASRRGEI